MPNFSAENTMDDFSVVTKSGISDFFEIFSNLRKDISAAKWKEVKERSDSNDELTILLETAIGLSGTKDKIALFRKNADADDTLIQIWHSRVLKKARSMLLTESASEFHGLRSADIREIAKISSDPKSPKYIGEYLKDKYGIILVIERAFSGMKFDGFAVKLETGHPIVGVSLRYPRYNNFWFTLLHELSHVSMHYEILDAAIYDDLKNLENSEVEKEANRLATDSIVPRYIFNKSPAIRSPQNKDLLFALAKQAEVHPILVAGMLQHHAGNFRMHADIVNEINVRELLGIAQ
jgi:HTH-type transcriptional regulator / antitoxin HigA